jgi:hypothetical protein
VKIICYIRPTASGIFSEACNNIHRVIISVSRLRGMGQVASALQSDHCGWLQCEVCPVGEMALWCVSVNSVWQFLVTLAASSTA